MSHFGTIKSYNRDKGLGTITPENGGDALPFAKSSLQPQSGEPKVDERFGYETSEIDGGKKHAVNLQSQKDRKDDQARKQNG